MNILNSLLSKILLTILSLFLFVSIPINVFAVNDLYYLSGGEYIKITEQNSASVPTGATIYEKTTSGYKAYGYTSSNSGTGSSGSSTSTGSSGDNTFDFLNILTTSTYYYLDSDGTYKEYNESTAANVPSGETIYEMTFGKYTANSIRGSPADPYKQITSSTESDSDYAHKDPDLPTITLDCNGFAAIPCAIADFAVWLMKGMSFVFMTFGRYILVLVLEDFKNFGGFTASDNFAIGLGWPIVRNLANAVLLIGLIIIAINIILGNNEDKAKKDLINFIIIALLINFTPVICAFIIEGANILMNNFLVGQIDSSYAKSFEFILNNKLADPNKTANLIYGLFLLLFSLISFTIYCLYALLFAIRYVILWILVIVSPIALVTKIFPQSKYVKKIFPSIMHWDDWSEQFAQWTVIGIPAGLFIYLSNQIMVGIASVKPPDGTGIIALLFAYTIPIFFLIVGFFVTTSAGGQVGSFVGGVGTGLWAATGAKQISKATSAIKEKTGELWDKSGGAVGNWGGERISRGLNATKEGAIGIIGSKGAGIGVDQAAREARVAGRYAFRETIGNIKEGAVNAGILSPQTLTEKTPAQKKAEEYAKGIDFEHYEAHGEQYDSITRAAIEKKLMEENMGKFMKTAKTKEQYASHLLSVEKNGSAKAKDSALANSYGNDWAPSGEELAQRFKIKDITEKDSATGKSKESVESYLAKKIKDKDSVGAASEKLLSEVVGQQLLAADQYAKIAKDGSREQIEAVSKSMKTLVSSKGQDAVNEGVRTWYGKAGAASAVYGDWDIKKKEPPSNKSDPSVY